MSKNTIALVGNPNCGKTTLFNGLTGGKIKTGNWPGVTVEKREGTLNLDGQGITVVDLPGIYSFSAHSEDEKVARDYILSGEPSLVINILDATNIERNFYLTIQLLEMKIPVILVINMMDIAGKQGIKIDLEKLQKKLSLPIIAVSAIEKKDIQEVKSFIKKYYTKPCIAENQVEYPNELEGIIADWQTKVIHVARELTIDSRWIAIKLLENDSWVKEKILAQGCITEEEIGIKQKSIEDILEDSPDILCADTRYGFIHGITRDVVQRTSARRSFTDKLDKIVLNRVLGIPIFLVMMYFLFWVTITLGGAFIDFFDIFFGTIFVDGFGTLLETMGVPVWLKVILADGAGGGIQTVATFIPIIFFMFFMLSLLEDSGYMARAAFVMDRFMKFLGLPGKAFVPLLVGFGCTVPAVMATRTLESKKDRFLTIFMAPFMSCGARLPVYALFIAAFFPKNGGLIVFSIYLVGILFAILTGLLLKNTLFKSEASYFIMELPPYHRPRFRHIFLHTWDRLKGFIWRAGKVIVIVVAVLGILNSFGTDGSFGNEDQETSVLAAMGRAITPVFEPMGVEKSNWPATVGLFTGIFAKEAVVGTLSSLYGQIAATEAEASGETEEEEPFDFWTGIGDAFASIPEGLSGVLAGLADPFGLGIVQETDENALAEEIGTEVSVFGLMSTYFSKGGLQAYAYLLFILLYFPCVAAFGAVMKETGVAFGVLNAIYLTLLGWIVATLFYQVTVGHDPFWIVVPLVLTGLIIGGLHLLKKTKAFQIIREVNDHA